VPRSAAKRVQTSHSAALTGPYTLAELSGGIAALQDLSAVIELDLSGVTALDTAGAWAFVSHQAAQKAKGRNVVFLNATPAQALLLQTVAEAMPAPRVRRRRPPHHRAGDTLARLGQTVAVFAVGMAQSIGFFGLVVSRLAKTVRHPSRLRVTSMVHHMQQTGLDAVPIVALMGVLIGVVLAYQGASQLKQFGAEVFVVDLIAISIMRCGSWGWTRSSFWSCRASWHF
jgi:phospholipid/cholesterol/gamma-HCH transport system permease protein